LELSPYDLTRGRIIYRFTASAPMPNPDEQPTASV
jgi:hypothetical protein